jgi:hypothetical protein
MALTLKIPELIGAFFRRAARDRIQFYNEPCAQLELAIFLRASLPAKQVQLERPITSFSNTRVPGSKKEIDICLLDEKGAPDTAIEIKYPRNGRIPETIFDYCKDIEFCELLCGAGFRRGYALFVTSDSGFFAGRHTGGGFTGRFVQVLPSRASSAIRRAREIVAAI